MGRLERLVFPYMKMKDVRRELSAVMTIMMIGPDSSQAAHETKHFG
ncbi:hypothetical protein [Neobacillus kokaensis]|uniref:Uncharacterized protein n=1 Tax=Neobacillus kokaensis TaxID=2759023 RepID=A0ABQ3N3U1_9BACI|nr:hypothetical protein [Neobacillus kokaensis]GHH99377.1 hypothetical protein AM1BK_29200 [Neobacillus kokaensis]